MRIPDGGCRDCRVGADFRVEGIAEKVNQRLSADVAGIGDLRA